MLVATLVAESLLDVRLVDRYSLPLVAAGIAFATALLVFMRWRAATATLALGALVATVWIENPNQDSTYRYYLRLASKVRSDQREVAALADDPIAERAIAECPDVIVRGRDWRKVLEAWPIVALHLDRDLPGVEVNRTSVGGFETSTVRFRSPSGRPPYLRRDEWVFRSACLRGAGSGAGERSSAAGGKRGAG